MMTPDISEIQETNEALQAVQQEIDAVKKSSFYLIYGSMGRKGERLEILYDGIKRKLAGEDVDFNQPVTTNSPMTTFYQPSKETSFIKIAVKYCPEIVVRFLLENGAKADITVVKSAMQFDNKDLSNILKTLKEFGVNLNGLHKNHTLMYRAVQEDNKDAVKALSSNHARMGFFEAAQNQAHKIHEKLKAPVHKVIGRMIPNL